jgi:hypothetical protein
VLVQVVGDALDVVGVRLQPVVVVGVIPGRGRAPPAARRGTSGELLGDEHVGRSAICRTPAIVSWSVIVTKSMPRRLASS